MRAAQRARDISAGAKETVERDNDKSPVVALREIADDTLELKDLEESLIRTMQKHVLFEDDEDEDVAVDLVLTSAGEIEVGTELPASAVPANDIENPVKTENEGA